MRMRNDGRKIAPRAKSPIVQSPGGSPMTVPRYAEKVNKRPRYRLRRAVSGYELFVSNPARRHDLGLEQRQHYVPAAEHHRAAAVEAVEDIEPVVLPCLPENRQPDEQDEEQRETGNCQVASERRWAGRRNFGVGLLAKQEPADDSGRGD